MKPSRKLDVLVAEKVMGHKVFYDHGQSLIASGQEAFDKMIITDHLFWEGTSDENEYCLQLPAYSTNIAAAFTVDKPGWLWEFQETGQVLTVTLYISPEMLQESIWDFPILPEGVILIRREWLDDKAQTYAWLRCLAALEAIEKENEDEAK